MVSRQHPGTIDFIADQRSESTESPHSDALSQEDHEDVEQQLDLEQLDNNPSAASSVLYPEPSKTVVSFASDDTESPFNWSKTRKCVVVGLGIFTVLNSTLGSSMPSGDGPPIQQHFSVTVEEQLVLPTSIFLVGYVLGPLIFSPLSEEYGRQSILLGTFAGYTIFTVATCVAPNWAAFNIFRLLCGVFASSPISVIGGLYADLYDNPIARGRAMAIFMAATTWGPIFGPVVSGFLSYYGWRWPFWFLLIFAGVTWPALVFLPETYGPVILKRRAKKIRKQTGSKHVFAPIELEQTSIRDICVKVLTRPFRMFFTEWIVLFSCLFLCYVYAIYYMFFQVYPLIYIPIYGFGRGQEGLAFLSIGIGAMFACAMYLWWDWYLERARARGATWCKSEEYRRLPLACMGGPFFVIGIFWTGWAARPSVHWIVPMLGGIPMGIGFLLLFMALINYIVDACKFRRLLSPSCHPLTSA